MISATAPAMPPLTPGAMSHIRVLDMTRILAGPWCAQNFADMGAEVIKVERPGAGDDTRTWGPPWIKDGDGRDTTDAGYFACANRGKQSVAVDISKPEGRALVLELAAQCDVLIENYKVGDLKRYGLDYEAVSAINPRIVYCSVTGYGQTGPDAHKPGYDFVFQGIGGLMSVTGERDDRPGGGPQKVGIAVTDVLTGMYSTVAILAALNYRAISGRGQYIDMALLDCIVAFGANQISNQFVSGKAPARYGNAHASLVPYEAFRTAQGHLIIAAGNDQQWLRCCEALGRPDLAADTELARGPGRLARREELVADLQGTLMTRPAAYWIERLEALGVPCGPINNYQQVFELPQVKHRGLRVDLQRGDGGATSVAGSPLRMSATPVRYKLAPPLLGEHTEPVLRRLLGKNDGEIRHLRERGVL